jgi:signal transduction histidine kinase
VLGDVEALERAMRMLIDNACRYTQPGGWIRLSVNENADVVCVSVSDSGIGIADHEQARIFERFYRAQQSQESRQAGSGLGLSLAKWIVEQHQGSITVTSKVGAGSSFRISLPTYVAAIDA